MYEGNLASIDPKARKHVSVLLHRGAKIPGDHPQLEVGEESGIDTASIELHWPLLSKGSVADGARLHFDEAATPFSFRLTSIEVDEAD